MNLLPHRLPEYRAMGYADVRLGNEKGEIILERNIETEEEIGKVIINTKKNLEALAQSIMAELDREDGKSEWSFEYDDTVTVKGVSRSTFTSLIEAAIKGEFKPVDFL